MSYFDKSKFEYYYKSFKNGTYFGVVPDEDGMEKIKDLVKKLNLKNPIEEEKIHVTLMYSEDKGNPLIPPSDLVYEAKPVSFALFGPAVEQYLRSSDVASDVSARLAVLFGLV